MPTVNYKDANDAAKTNVLRLARRQKLSADTLPPEIKQHIEAKLLKELGENAVDSLWIYYGDIKNNNDTIEFLKFFVKQGMDVNPLICGLIDGNRATEDEIPYRSGNRDWKAYRENNLILGALIFEMLLTFEGNPLDLSNMHFLTSYPGKILTALFNFGQGTTTPTFQSLNPFKRTVLLEVYRQTTELGVPLSHFTTLPINGEETIRAFMLLANGERHKSKREQAYECMDIVLRRFGSPEILPAYNRTTAASQAAGSSNGSVTTAAAAAAVLR